ncbi:peptidase M16 [Paenibacillus sp. VTT E-133280]|uniref:EF-P 5-aminopentanol modification-associated protein YfmF n=1 Tax=Paenibacillus TaxID=44249 RepID=UPI000BA0223F|nr:MULTISPECIES: pitrilysin family protein [unclassified Paenibacillus]MDH6369109.1 putative Zn-dependent peptidase [Paenibacillus sp. PastF-3]OZQ66497.1 peptidase M16 [Paenibacillus sp. VTT E-133280]OZQ86893.1 peptidase M16 [Paenibacillus sp. VTT E-133291]
MTNNVFQHGTVGGLRIHVMPTKAFKTYAISLYAGIPLDENTVTSTALAPFVLRRGTATYPETTQFRERLEELYGAGFGFDIYKRGDYQIVQFRMDTINDSFVQSQESLLEQSFAFLGEVLTRPLVEDGSFRPSYVATERETVRKKLESIVNDKIRYAAERCIEEMCRKEPYRLHPLGQRADLDQITPKSLYESYNSWLDEAILDLYVVGDTTTEEVEQLVQRHFGRVQSEVGLYSSKFIPVSVNEVRTVEEKLDVSQGKLNLGLRTSITYKDDNYASAIMYNGILGGYPHSKLFVNVREKASLAYYASSRYDGHKGIGTIQSGIETQNYGKAVDIIEKQLEEMKAGNISDLELSQTKAMIRNQLSEIPDSAFEMISYDFNRQLSGKERTADQLLGQVEQIGAEDVKAAAETFQLDTIYFLTGKEE